MNAMQLCGDFCSVLGKPHVASLPQMTDAGVHVFQCDTAHLTSLFNNVRGWAGDALSPGAIAGASSELSADDANFKAVCEAAERYSSCVLLPSEYRVSTYNDLNEPAIDWRTLPKLDDDELSDPLQPFSRFNPDDPIRWIMGLHLNTGKPRLLPTALTHLFPRLWSTERFGVPISTGTAVHTSEVIAITSALCEVIERDATALTWLLRRPLQSIALGGNVQSTLHPIVEQLIRSSEVTVYDATTDVGVPTVYARRRQPGSARVANVVGCASAFDFVKAIEKSVKEAVMVSRTLEQGNFPLVSNPMDCESVYDGAVFMARASKASAFGFLDDNGQVMLSDLRNKEPSCVSEDSERRLLWLLRRFDENNMDAYVVNITCDELRDVGLKCYRAIVPQLMPMSLIRRGRFLATPRLKEVNYLESLHRNIPVDINPEPQPFA